MKYAENTFLFTFHPLGESPRGFRVLLLIFLLFLSACSGEVGKPITPTIDPYRINRANATNLVYLTRFGDDWVNSISWSPDGNSIVVGTIVTLDFYDTRTYERYRSINPNDVLNGPSCENCPGGTSDSVVFSPDGQRVASTFSRKGTNILIWDANSGELIDSYATYSPPVENITFSPDGTMLAGCSPGNLLGAIIIWNTSTGEIADDLYDHGDYGSDFHVYRTAFSPDSTLLISGGFDGEVRLWDAQTGELVKRIKVDIGITGITFTPDGNYFAAGGSDGTIMVWDRFGNLIRQMTGSSEDYFLYGITNIAFNPLGDLIAAGTDNGHIQVFDFETGTLLQDIEVSDSPLSVSAIGFSPDGRVLAAGDYDGNVRLWVVEELASQMPTPTPVANSEIISYYKSLPPGQYIVYSESQGMKVLSSDASIQQSLTDDLTGSAQTADGRIMQLYGDIASSLNLLTGQITKYPFSGVISPDGEWIAKSGDCENQLGIEIAHVQDGGRFCFAVGITFPDYSDDVMEIMSEPQWSTDGHWLAFLRITVPIGRSSPQPVWVPLASNGLYLIDTTCFLDSESCPGKTEFAIHYPNKLSPYSRLKWSPDGNYAVANSDDRFVVFNLSTSRVWFIDHEIDLDNYEPQDFAVSADSRWIAYSSDGTDILRQSLNTDTTIRVLDGLSNTSVLAWLTVPLLEVGESFIVLPAGDNLGVRDTPLSSNTTTYLRTGDGFTVLRGPVQTNGYTWWYIRSEQDGVEGWIQDFYGWFIQK